MGITRFHHGQLVRAKRDWLTSITATETLVVLGVVVLLAAVLVPTVRSQWAVSEILQARYEAEQLHAAFMRFYHDTGHMPSIRSDAPQNARNAVRTGGIVTLITDGTIPDADHDPQCTGWTRANSDWINAHLIENKPGYPSRDTAGYGWNGPYLDQPIGPDPWGQCYIVNIAYFDDSKQSKDKDGNIKRAVFILSSGPDGRIDTPWTQPITTAQARGDDVTLRLQ